MEPILLEIARKHLMTIQRKITDKDDEGIGEEGVIVTVFSAMAVEACTNRILVMPVLNIEDKEKRYYWKTVIEEFLFSPITKKGKILFKLAPHLKGMKRDLKNLFDHRNRWVHLTGEIHDGPELEQVAKNLNIKGDLAPTLQYEHPSNKDVNNAIKDFATAERFIALMNTWEFDYEKYKSVIKGNRTSKS